MVITIAKLLLLTLMQLTGAGKEIENTAMYVKYAFDSFTVGIQDNESDSDACK